MEEGKRRWFDPTQPLWLPPGTVRAIIVLLGMIACVYPLFKLVTWGGTLDQSVKEILMLVIGYLTAIIKDYFGAREEERGGPPDAPTP